MSRRILLLCLFTVSASFLAAQENKPAAPKMPNFVKLMRSETMRQTQKAGSKAAMDSMWNGKGMNLMVPHLVDDAEVRQAWGITDEQHKKLNQQALSMALMKNPEFMAYNAELTKLRKPEDPFFLDPDKETKEKYAALQEKFMGIVMESMTKEIDDVMTPEQQNKMKEFQLSAMSESPIVTPNTFEVLGLSDEQKAKMEAVKKKLEPDWKNLMDETLEHGYKSMDKICDMLDKEGEITDVKAFQEKIVAAAKKLNETDPEVKRINEEMKKKGQGLMTRLRFEMYDILTDEQMARLEELVNHPPAYVGAAIKRMKEKYGQGDQADAAKSAMDAWKPGEAIPEEYKQQRKRKSFPTNE